MTQKKVKVFPKIVTLIQSLDPTKISDSRKEKLRPLIEFVQNKVDCGHAIRLNFICTHNSRRSFMAQVWAQSLAAYFNLKNVFCYSGGTETTALFPKVAETLKNSGFQLKTISEGKNPVYSIKFSENEHPVIGVSKKHDDDFNPKSEFAAIMTCSQADAACPFIAGAEKRISLPFEDPKKFDDSPQETEIYQERNLQIAVELFYVFSKIQANQ